MSKSLYYLDDLHVGQRFKSGTHTLDAAQIKAFATQYDPQPFHMDEKAAENTLFKGLAASGWHTAAITIVLWSTEAYRFPAALLAAAES